MSRLSFDDVSIRYGNAATGSAVVSGVSLEVPAGQIVGLVGESGSGKSTLGKAAVGLVTPYAGRVSVDGAAVGSGARRSRPVQMVFQDPYSSLDPRMRVGQSIAEALPGGLNRSGRSAEVRRLLELVQLDGGQAAALPREMSGGQRQRVALARALAGRPAYVVADEMTSALDVSVQGAMLNLIKELRVGLGIGILFISHDLAVVRYVCDSVAVMTSGVIVERGTVETVLDRPEHPYTQALLASIAASGRAAGR